MVPSRYQDQWAWTGCGPTVGSIEQCREKCGPLSGTWSILGTWWFGPFFGSFAPKSTSAITNLWYVSSARNMAFTETVWQGIDPWIDRPSGTVVPGTAAVTSSSTPWSRRLGTSFESEIHHLRHSLCLQRLVHWRLILLRMNWGYRLLRASKLSSHERQNILVQTSNSTSFNLVRRALRTLYAEEADKSSAKPSGRVWFEEWDPGFDNGEHAEDVWWSEWDDWADWSPSSQTYWCDDDWNEWADDWDFAGTMDEIVPDEQSGDPQEQQLVEAFNIASEANRTLRDARDADRRVRQSRGYYSSESNSGKGIVPASTSAASSPSSGKGLGKSKGLGLCFICGMRGHTYMQCPDRHAKGGSKGKFKSGKGSFGVWQLVEGQRKIIQGQGTRLSFWIWHAFFQHIGMHRQFMAVPPLVRSLTLARVRMPLE